MPDNFNASIDPARIPDQKFSTVRRGADPTEVERYLRRIAIELKASTDRESDLRRQLEMIRSAPVPETPDPLDPLDPSRLTKLLGEETTRVLDAAQSAAAEIRARAEESVARLLREAREESNELRESTESLIAQKNEDAKLESIRLHDELLAEHERAATEAARIVDDAKSEGRALVLEAQQMRKRMLDDLAARREQLREQIEQLQSGRDRLFAAYEGVRQSVTAATAELKGAFPSGADIVDEIEFEPAGLGIDMPMPTTSDQEESKSPENSTDSPSLVTLEEIETETSITAVPSGPPRSPALPTAQKSGLALVQPYSPTPAPTPLPAPLTEVEAVQADLPEKVDSPSPDLRKPTSSVRVVRTSSGKASDVFARLREEGAEEVSQHTTSTDDIAVGTKKSTQAANSELKPKQAEISETEIGAGAGAGAGVDTQALESAIDVSADADQRLIVLRNEVAAPIEAALSRRIKRELSDQQNEMLAAISSVRGTISVHDILPMSEDHLERYEDISLAALSEAAVAGAGLASGRGRASGHSSVADLAADLAASVVMPLRERLESSIEALGREREDLAQAIRATFREWKGQRVDDEVSMHVRAACNRGLLDRLPKTSKVRWVVADGDAPSPDCDDNALAGVISNGTAFPTGSRIPPLRPGCHCIVAPADN